MTAELQAKRRLGLTATLVREDGREDDVFSLIGPKRYDAPWKELESQGWIAEAVCSEIRVALEDRDYRMKYATAPQRMKYRVAAENPRKLQVVGRLISEHAKSGESILVFGDYLDQLTEVSRLTGAPFISGKLPNSERERLYSSFRTGEEKLLVVSKVANYAIDLPDASVAIQISGTFGSRQEEAQRLGRLLRPKNGGRRTSTRSYQGTPSTKTMRRGDSSFSRKGDTNTASSMNRKRPRDRRRNALPLPKPWIFRTSTVLGLFRGLWFLLHWKAERLLSPAVAGLPPPRAFRVSGQLPATGMSSYQIEHCAAIFNLSIQTCAI